MAITRKIRMWLAIVALCLVLRKLEKRLLITAGILGFLIWSAIDYFSCVMVLGASGRPNGVPHHSLHEALSDPMLWPVSLFPTAILGGIQLLGGMIVACAWTDKDNTPMQRTFELTLLCVLELGLAFGLMALVVPPLLRHPVSATLVTTAPGLSALLVVVMTAAAFPATLLGANIIEEVWLFIDPARLPHVDEEFMLDRLQGVGLIFVLVQVVLVGLSPQGDLVRSVPVQTVLALAMFILVLPALATPRRTQLA